MANSKTTLVAMSSRILREQTKLNTLADLVNAAEIVLTRAPRPCARKRREWLWCLHSGVRAICSFLDGKAAESILISEIVPIETALDEWLRRTCTPGMRNQNIAQYRFLVRFARAIGWSPQTFAVQAAWERLPISTRGIGTLVRAMIRARLTPDQVTEGRLAAWTEDRTGDPISCAQKRKCVWDLKFRIRKARAGAKFPHLDIALRYSRFAIGIRKMNPKLRADLFPIVRRLEEQHRSGLIRKNKVTLTRFIRNTERLYGYCVNIRHMSREIGLAEIFEWKVVSEFARWLRNKRGFKRSSLSHTLSSFHSALSNDPRFGNQELSWMLKLINEFKPEPESEKEARDTVRAFDYDYDALAVIPGILRTKWKTQPDLTREGRAWIIHDCLLMLWLLTVPWPPACLRRCRITGKLPNLVRRQSARASEKDTSEPYSDAPSRPVQGREEWWFRFTARESPLGQSVNGPLPERLVKLLELYLACRPCLLQGHSTSTLFLNRDGREMTALGLLRLVGNLTEEFVGRRVAPTAFRPIFAYYWLHHHPGDYKTVASILWEGLPAIKLRFDPQYRQSRRARILARKCRS